jgi:mannose-6-phosphate isomerase-like protein (cupin superfamily)
VSSRIFSPTAGFKVPDGTVVSPFLNPADRTSGLEPELLDALAFSLATGLVPADSESAIHAHPLVTQVTVLLEGRLVVRLREPHDPEMVELALEPGQAVLSRRGSFLQLVNSGDTPCRTLYVVSPPYVFEGDEAGNVVFDDSVVICLDWQTLRAMRWEPPALENLEDRKRARAEAMRRRRGESL